MDEATEQLRREGGIVWRLILAMLEVSRIDDQPGFERARAIVDVIAEDATPSNGAASPSCWPCGPPKTW